MPGAERPLADDGGDDGSTAAANQACLSTVTACNIKVTTGCGRYCDALGQPNCLKGCEEDYGYIDDISRYCINLLNQQMTAHCYGNPPEPPAAKKAAFDAPPPDETGAVPVPRAKPAPADPKDPKVAPDGGDTPPTKKTACSLNSARSICKRTASTPTTAKQGGINGTCTQATNANVQASNDWKNIASDCTDAINACKDSCSGSDAAACDDLTSYRDDAIDQQTTASSNGGSSGLGCQQKTGDGMSPSSNPGGNNPTAMSPSSTAAQDCANGNPVACQQQQNQNQLKTASDTGTQSGMVGNQMAHGIPNASGMNVGGDLGGAKQGPNFNNQQQQAPGATPMNPMMGGGSSGSGFGQNANNANAGGAGAGPHGMHMAAKDDKANVLKGERSGQGGVSGARGIASIEEGRRRGGGGAFGNMDLGGGKDEFGRMRGLDLKAYLPGGRQDPNRHVGGYFGRPDVHAAHENLFNIVSTRFQVHCKLQMLYGCR